MLAIVGGLGAAAAFAAATLCSSRSTRLIGPSSVLAWVMLVGLLLTGPLAIRDGLPAQLVGGSFGWVVLAGCGNVLGLLLGYAGLRIGHVGLVAPILSAEGALAAVISVVAGEPIALGMGATLGLIALGVGLAAAARGEPSRWWSLQGCARWPASACSRSARATASPPARCWRRSSARWPG